MPQEHTPPSCPLPTPPDETALLVLEMRPPSPIADYREAMAIANDAAGRELGEAMLIAWYDRDRDFESPQHASECHQDSAVPGYVDYAMNHGATLKVIFENGRFVFYYLPIDL
jgi:hypothetical protein